MSTYAMILQMKALKSTSLIFKINFHCYRWSLQPPHRWLHPQQRFTLHKHISKRQQSQINGKRELNYTDNIQYLYVKGKGQPYSIFCLMPTNCDGDFNSFLDDNRDLWHRGIRYIGNLDNTCQYNSSLLVSVFKWNLLNTQKVQNIARLILYYGKQGYSKCS